MAMYVFARGDLTFLGHSRHNPADPREDIVTPGVPPEVVAAAKERMSRDVQEDVGYIGDWFYHGFRPALADAAAMILGTRGLTREAVLTNKRQAIWAIEQMAEKMLSLLPPEPDEIRSNNLLDLEFA